MAYYRNNTTGKVQFHPKSGIGPSLGSTEIAEDGKAVKPRTSLAPSSDELRSAKALLKDNTQTPSATKTKTSAPRTRKGSKTSGTKAGDTNKQEGDQ